jgi:hypothetical protein
MVTQRTKPIWDHPYPYTHTEVKQYRERTLLKTGPKLLRRLGWELTQYAETEEPIYLGQANETVATIAALAPGWQDLSVDIFIAGFPDMAKDHKQERNVTPEKLLESYRRLLAAMAQAAQ